MTLQEAATLASKAKGTAFEILYTPRIPPDPAILAKSVAFKEMVKRKNAVQNAKRRALSKLEIGAWPKKEKLE
jgi:hypothetical protein